MQCNDHKPILELLKEYLTFFREFNEISGHNKRVIKIGDIVMVQL